MQQESSRWTKFTLTQYTSWGLQAVVYTVETIEIVYC